MGGGERRKQARREQRERVEELAAEMRAPEEPLVWRAGRQGRLVGLVWCLSFVALTDRPDGARLAHPDPGALFFAVWTSLVAAWIACRFSMWRITADRSGVYLRRMWSTRFIAWSVIGRVEIRRDGLLEFIGPQQAPMSGLFMPPWLARLLLRPGTGGLTADTLTAMARHSHLRPIAQAPHQAGGSAFVRWAIPLAIILYSAMETLRI